jgi:hypothetical protein
MKLFKCQSCEQILYFENTVCEKCSHRLGYLSEEAALSALEPEGDTWRALATPRVLFRFRANAAHDACNCLIAATSDSPLCVCCQHNRTIPDLSDSGNLAVWRRIEMATHRLFHSLLRFGLPMPTANEDSTAQLAFDVLAEPLHADSPRVMTGHNNGLITLGLAEADDREKSRVDMHEPYRTLLGHFRHETGHCFWDRLVRDGNRLEACRALFGDDTQDYAQAHQAYYGSGAPTDWQSRFVSDYAASHPWEDLPRHGRTTCTLSTRWRPRAPSACRPVPS